MKGNNLRDLIFEYLKKSQYKEAISFCQQQIQKNTNEYNLFWYWYLGLSFILDGEPEFGNDVWISTLLSTETGSIDPLVNVLEEVAFKFAEWQKLSELDQTINLLKEINNGYHNEILDSEKSNLIKSLRQKAITASLRKRTDEALNIYLQLIRVDSQHDYSWHNLGMVYYEKENYSEAYHAISEAINLNNKIGRFYFSMGLVLEKLGDTETSKKAYQETINLDHQFVDAYNNLGQLEKTCNNLIEAENLFRKAISINPKFFGTYINLGSLFFLKEQYKEAIVFYKQASELKPENPDIFYNLALCHEKLNLLAETNLYSGYRYYFERNYQKAIESFQSFLQERIGDINVYLFLAECYKNINQAETAIQAYTQGIKAHPQESRLYKFLAYTYYKHLGDIQNAIQISEQAYKLFPSLLIFQYFLSAFVPLVYNSSEEIINSRQQFTHFLAEFTDQIISNIEQTKENALDSISSMTNYYLGYQNMNDLELQIKYGNLVHEVMSANYPQWKTCSITLPQKSEKIRIGYISKRLSKSLGEMLIGWLKHSNKDKFKIYCYDLGSSNDSKNPELKVYSDRYYSNFPDQVEVICEQIQKDKLDILVYLDVGMDPIMIKVAALRLAPIQCTTWGHPITSGLKTIDYFLSSGAMESPEGEKYYSEKLVRLPNMGLCLSKPLLSESPSRKERSYFNLKDGDTIYLSCQHISKYLPQSDHLFVEIAQTVPNAKLVFIEGMEGKLILQQFRQRLTKVFQEYNLDITDLCHFLPLLDYADYFELLKLSDVFLDTIGWSGGITSLDALSCNLPIVTLPGEFLRGRQSYGMLKIMGITETIATNEQEYVEIATRLGIDTTWRAAIQEKISLNYYKLVDDLSCVEYLENFYQTIVENQKVI